MAKFEVTLRPTGRFEKYDGTIGRIWEGETNSGTPVEFLVPSVRSPTDAPQEDLQAALQEIPIEILPFDA